MQDDSADKEAVVDERAQGAASHRCRRQKRGGSRAPRSHHSSGPQVPLEPLQTLVAARSTCYGPARRSAAAGGPGVLIIVVITSRKELGPIQNVKRSPSRKPRVVPYMITVKLERRRHVVNQRASHACTRAGGKGVSLGPWNPGVVPATFCTDD
ncbi:hypothetical protein MTO96_026968 [Rhipicephalus appendiculatus]